MRDICSAISELETSLVDMYDLTLNEAMVMCSIGSEKVAAGEISSRTGLRASHLSKVLRALEEKNYLTRDFGDKDKRQIYFSLTDEALQCLDRLKNEGLPIPEYLEDLFRKKV